MCYLAGLVLNRVFDDSGLMLVNKSINQSINESMNELAVSTYAPSVGYGGASGDLGE